MTFGRLEHNVNLLLTVLERAELIQEAGGFGALHIDFRRGTMVSCKTTVRDHPPKRLQNVGQDSHPEVGEELQGD